MTTWAIVLLVLGFIAMDAIVVTTIMRSAVGSWNTIANKHPGAEPAPGAVRKNFQSFKLGMLNLGWSVHVAVDPDHLHLHPAKIVRVFGARPMSIPWEAIKPKKTGRRYTSVRIGMADLTGPNWCFELARFDS